MLDIERELAKNKVHKISNQYVLTGKGEDWNEVKNEVEEIYDAWIISCVEFNQTEADILARINSEKFDIAKEKYPDRGVVYFFCDENGVIGNPFILQDSKEESSEDVLNIFLLLMFISSKVSENSKKKIQDFVKAEYIN